MKVRGHRQKVNPDQIVVPPDEGEAPTYYKPVTDDVTGLWVKSEEDWRRVELSSYRRAVVTEWAGSRNSSAKLTEADIPEIRRLYNSGMYASQIAEQFKVTTPTIQAIIWGRNWKHINAEWLDAGTRKRTTLSGEKCVHAKLNTTNIYEIRQRIRGGESYTAIAEQFGVHTDTIENIAKNRTWKHVKDYEGPIPSKNVMLTPEVVNEIRSRFNNGETGNSIAKQLGSSRSTISRALGPTWDHVETTVIHRWKRLNEHLAKEIRERYRQGETQVVIARHLGISPATVRVGLSPKWDHADLTSSPDGNDTVIGTPSARSESPA